MNKRKWYYWQSMIDVTMVISSIMVFQTFFMAILWGAWLVRDARLYLKSD